MKIIIKPGLFPPFSDIYTRFSTMLSISRKILTNLGIKVEEVDYARIYALPKRFYSPNVTEVEYEVLPITLNKDLQIVTKPKTDKDLIWREAFLRTQFLAKINSSYAVFTIIARGSGKTRKDYGDIEFYAYGDGFEGFDQLLIKENLQIERGLVEGVKFFVVGPLDATIYDLTNIIAFSTEDIRTFLATVIRFLRKISQKKNQIERDAVKLLNSFLNFSTILAKIYNKEEIINAIRMVFEMKGYRAIRGSLTIYGNKPLYDGYVSLLEKVIIPLLKDFPTDSDFEDRLHRGLSRIRLS